MAALGTLAWMEASGGRMGRLDRLRTIADGVRARIAARTQVAARRPHRAGTVDDLELPGSAVAHAAMALCKEASRPFLFNHCVRAYYWSRLLDDGARPFDDEALFVAFMLHDLGLTERYRLEGDSESCFTIVGARHAEELGARHGWDGLRCRLVAEAITLHLNVIVSAAHGREAELVRLGSGADVAGLGLGVLDQAAIDAVVTRHPRLELKREFLATLGEEARNRPRCRIAYLQSHLGFRGLIAGAPMFAE